MTGLDVRISLAARHVAIERMGEGRPSAASIRGRIAPFRGALVVAT
jgi:hypothetical protein